MATYDFFISYTEADAAWADWIARTLMEVGYACVLQSWDIVPGDNFVRRMHEASVSSDRTLFVLSAAFLESKWGMLEVFSALARDPDSSARTVLPVRVQNVTPPGIMRALVYVDLYNKDKAIGKRALIEGVRACIEGHRVPASSAAPQRNSPSAACPAVHAGAAASSPDCIPVPPPLFSEYQRAIFDRLYKQGLVFLANHQECDLSSPNGRLWLAEVGSAINGREVLQSQLRYLERLTRDVRPACRREDHEGCLVGDGKSILQWADIRPGGTF